MRHPDERRRGCGCGFWILAGGALAGVLAFLAFAFPRYVTTSVVIQAPPARVWPDVVDFDGYARWNPYVRQMTGEPSLGSELRATLEGGGFELDLSATVTAAVPGEALSWSGSVFWILLRDDHSVVLEPLPGGRTRLVHKSVLTGLVPALLWGRLEADVIDAYTKHNQKVKAESEGR